MSLWKWSKTSATNATADGSINYAEGQAPSSLNDSARAAMAAVAKYRDDINGTIVTGGTSTAFTVTSNQVFDTLAHMDGAMIAFVPHTTSGLAPTLNVDGLGAKKVRFQTGADIPEGALVAGTPYVVTYGNSATEFLLHNIAGNPYNVPVGAGMDYWSDNAPNSCFAFPYGQAISRSTYSTLFGLFGTAYGSGNGSTTFNLPDKAGRVSVAKDSLSGSAANRLTSATGLNGALGTAGGAERVTLVSGNLPQATYTTGTESATHTHGGSDIVKSQGTTVATGGSAPNIQVATNAASIGPESATHTHDVTIGNASPTAVAVMQPSIICSYIIRII